MKAKNATTVKNRLSETIGDWWGSIGDWWGSSGHGWGSIGDWWGGFSEDLPLSDLWNVWFQHDGAPPYKLSSVQQCIRDTFQQQVIGYGGCVEWPPHSPDPNPLDFFRGRVKQRVYATSPPTLQELRNRITDTCASVSPAMLYHVQREVQSRVQLYIVAEGHHFEHDR
ncbi:hypothetical protein AVEN_19244-1 [Araneus ventricosus]|uniref:Tc1-like transposase DDE domain-containing protein n=1 Tax=Araneus ventricosus TaxID=182803 RepID=A0A4Y2QGX7_ARAVE|nr:hypothetical protein AVEN_19244-1 [Araneus ventricosus]